MPVSFDDIDSKSYKKTKKQWINLFQISEDKKIRQS